MGMRNANGNVFVFVIWSAARSFEPQIMSELEKRFKVLRAFDVTWSKRFFVRNLAAFYGWKSWHIWWNKARKCGTGPFRVIVVEDPSPVWKWDIDLSGHEMFVNENVLQLKRSFRALTGHSNVIHSSVTVDETTHQLAALDSPEQSPIPFRKMVYADDAHVRSEHRRMWLGLLGDVLTPLVAAVVAGAVVWLDVSVFGTNCAENGLVEWTGLGLSALCGFLMTLCAVRQKKERSAYALLAAFFLNMAVCEADQLLDEALGSTLWFLGVSAVSITFVAVTIRYAKTLYPGLRAVRRSHHFSLFTCGVALMLFVSQFLGQTSIWRAIGVSDAVPFGHFVEESVELFGYVLMTLWAIPCVCRALCKRGSVRLSSIPHAIICGHER